MGMWDLCKRNLHKKSSHADELRCRKHQERPSPTTNCDNMVSNRVNVYCDECVKVRPNHQAKGQNFCAANAMLQSQGMNLWEAGTETCSGRNLEKRAARSTVARVVCFPHAPAAK